MHNISPTRRFWFGSQLIADWRGKGLLFCLVISLTASCFGVSYTWNGGNGDWSVAGNWTPAGVPGGSDTATINSGAASLAGGIEVDTLNLGGGTVRGNGTLTVTNLLNWTNGQMGDGGGRTVIAPGAQLNLNNSEEVNLYQWTLENAGTVSWSGTGKLRHADVAVFTNRPGAVWQALNDQAFLHNGGPASRFDNAGTFRKAAGSTTFDNPIVWNNSGTVEVQSGILRFAQFNNSATATVRTGAALRLGNGSATGTFNVEAGALLEWLGGTYALNGGVSLNGEGVYSNASTLSVNSSVGVRNLDLGPGMLLGSGMLTVSNVFNWSGGGLEGGGVGRLVVAPGATLNLASTNEVHQYGWTLDNAGTVLWNGSGIYRYADGAVLTNRPGAIWEIQNDQPFVFTGGSGNRFDNAGTLRKSTAVGTSVFDSNLPFNNYGIVEVQSGRLRFNANGALTSTLSVAAGSQIEWAAPNSIFASGLRLGGAGAYAIMGNVTVSGSASVWNLDLSGTILGSGTLTVSNVFNWSSGGLEGGGVGRLVVAPGATLNLASTNEVHQYGWTLDNAGTVFWTGSGIYRYADGAVLTNRPGAVWEIRNDQPFVFTGGSGNRFDNAGTLRKSTAVGTSAFDGNLPFNNYGNLEILSGIIAANGGYTCSPGSILHSALGGTTAGTGFGRLQISGGVALNGNLSVDLVNGFYPAPNATFPVLTAGSRSGSFAGFYYPSNDVGMAVSNTANSVFVQVINVRPMIPVITGQTNDEQVLFSLNVSATDADLPPQTLTYSLTNSPSGTAIDSSGLITWIPTEEQGPLATNITVVVTDSGTPNLSAAQTFSIVINEINTPPVLTLPPDTVTSELVALSLSATATDSDIPTNALRYSLVSGPEGLTVSPAGAIAWTPTEAQGSNVHLVEISVTDTNAHAVNAKELSVTNSFSITVNEVNVAPVLVPPPDQIVLEETSLSLTNSVIDSDLPPNAFTFELLSAPTGMTINSANGVITWTPTESQGSNDYSVTVRVTDSNPLAINATHLSDTNSFVIIVNESNRPPVLPAQANLTIAELTLLAVTNAATDPDFPVNALGYTLLAAPTGAVISAEGVITWIPSEAQGPSTNQFVTVVTDTNALAVNERNLRTTNFFTVVVEEVNVAPVLTLPPSSTNNELVAYSANATATDADLPANTLTFELLSGPSGLTISPAGAINWTPTEAQGPDAYLVSVRVFDNGTPSLSHTQSFTLTVNEVNVAPELTPIANYSINPGQTVTFTATAEDGDSPSNPLGFGLLPPTHGATIDPNSGAFTWRSPMAAANTTNSFTVRVLDGGAPALDATQSFQVVVGPLLPVLLTPLALSSAVYEFSVNGPVGPDYVFQRSADFTNWTSFLTNTPVAMPISVSDTNANAARQFYRALLGP